MRGDGAVAEDGGGTAGEYGSSPTALGADLRDPHRVDPSVQQEETVGLDPMLDRVLPDARGQQLSSADYPVLARREASDDLIRERPGGCMWFVA